MRWLPYPTCRIPLRRFIASLLLVALTLPAMPVVPAYGQAAHIDRASTPVPKPQMLCLGKAESDPEHADYTDEYNKLDEGVKKLTPVHHEISELTTQPKDQTDLENRTMVRNALGKEINFLVKWKDRQQELCKERSAIAKEFAALNAAQSQLLKEKDGDFEKVALMYDKAEASYSALARRALDVHGALKRVFADSAGASRLAIEGYKDKEIVWTAPVAPDETPGQVKKQLTDERKNLFGKLMNKSEPEIVNENNFDEKSAYGPLMNRIYSLYIDANSRREQYSQGAKAMRSTQTTMRALSGQLPDSGVSALAGKTPKVGDTAPTGGSPGGNGGNMPSCVSANREQVSANCSSAGQTLAYVPGKSTNPDPNSPVAAVGPGARRITSDGGGAGNGGSGGGDDEERTRPPAPPPAKEENSISSWASDNKGMLIVGGVGAAAVAGVLVYKNYEDKKSRKEQEKIEAIGLASMANSSSSGSSSGSSGSSSPSDSFAGGTPASQQAPAGSTLMVSGIPAGAKVGTPVTSVVVKIIGPNGVMTQDSATDITVSCASPCGMSGTLTVNSDQGKSEFKNLIFSSAQSSVVLRFSAPGFATVTSSATFAVSQ